MSNRPIRIYTIARAVGVKSWDIVEFLRGRGIDVKTPSSSIPDDLAVFVGRFFSAGNTFIRVPRTEAEDRLVHVLAKGLREGRPASLALVVLNHYVETTGKLTGGVR